MKPNGSLRVEEVCVLKLIELATLLCLVVPFLVLLKAANDPLSPSGGGLLTVVLPVTGCALAAGLSLYLVRCLIVICGLLRDLRDRMPERFQGSVIAREFKHLEKIEKVNADARKKAGKGADGSGGRGKKKNLSENLPEGLEGKATDLAAAELGISGRTAEKAAVVVDEIDKLRPCYAPVAMV